MAALLEVLDYSFEADGNVTESNTNTTAGYTTRDLGSNFWNGSISCWLTDEGPSHGVANFAHGSLGAYELVENGTRKWAGNAYHATFSFSADIDDGGPIRMTHTVVGTGAPTYPTGTAAIHSGTGGTITVS